MTLGRLYKQRTAEASSGEKTTLLFSGARIPRDTFKAMTLADNVLREAETAAAALRAQTEAMLTVQKRQVHAQALAQGRAEGIVAVLGTLEVERRLRELLSHRMADIVEHCLRTLLGEIGGPQLLRQRILSLLCDAQAEGADSASGSGVSSGVATLYVGREQYPLAQSIVADLTRDAGANVAGLVVVLDERRAPDALLLETRLCFIDSDLTLTLQETRNLVQEALAHALDVLGDKA